MRKHIQILKRQQEIQAKASTPPHVIPDGYFFIMPETLKMLRETDAETLDQELQEDKEPCAMIQNLIIVYKELIAEHQHLLDQFIEPAKPEAPAEDLPKAKTSK